MELWCYIQTSSSGLKNLTCKASQLCIVCIPGASEQTSEKIYITISMLGWISAFIIWSIPILYFFLVSFSFLLLLLLLWQSSNKNWLHDATTVELFKDNELKAFVGACKWSAGLFVYMFCCCCCIGGIRRMIFAFLFFRGCHAYSILNPTF